MKQADNKEVTVASTEEIVDDLQKFFKTDQSRTTVGRLREMFETIEKLRDGGMSLENIRLVLEKNNLKIGLPTLTKSLQRIRAERNSKLATSAAAVVIETIEKRPAAPDLKHGMKAAKAKPKQPKIETQVVTTETENKETGFIDIFALQAEREAKKDTEKKIQKIPRR